MTPLIVLTVVVAVPYFGMVLFIINYLRPRSGSDPNPDTGVHRLIKDVEGCHSLMLVTNTCTCGEAQPALVQQLEDTVRAKAKEGATFTLVIRDDPPDFLLALAHDDIVTITRPAKPLLWTGRIIDNKIVERNGGEMLFERGQYLRAMHATWATVLSLLAVISNCAPNVAELHGGVHSLHEAHSTA
jgi:hypothetical protein